MLKSRPCHERLSVRESSAAMRIRALDPELFGLERNGEARSLHHEAAALAGKPAAVAGRESLGQRPGLVRREPQAQQVAVALGLGPVLEVGARMQDLVVVQELDVARTEVHRE